MHSSRLDSGGVPFIAPFLTFIAFLAVERVLPVSPDLLYPLRLAVVGAVLLTISRRVIPLRSSHWPGSILIGILVFAIWIGPDVLWPAYRTHWPFDNPITRGSGGSLPEHLRSNAAFLTLRVTGSVLLVPILEELFWRGWLLRWLVHEDFRKVPIGTYYASAFWIVAVMFASEHGAYWDVGFLAGVIYNWWVIRTKSLADCILAHAVTNACLASYVLLYHQWQYWP